MDLKKYQGKSITPVDEYVCNLSDELKKIAFSELNETDEIRNVSIKLIRDWVLESPRIIKTRLDSKFILRFLRYRKFDIEKTKESIERWMVMFEVSGFDHKLFSTNYDLTKLHMRELIRNKFGVLLPQHGRLNDCVINLCQLITFDPKVKGILGEVLTLAVLVHETLMEDEENQIRGTIVIEDCSNASFRHAILLSVPTWYKLLRNLEKCFNARLRSIHIVNLPTAVRFLAKIVLSNFSEKLNSRIHIHANVAEMTKCEDFKDVDFPVEYGGNLDYDELCDDMLKLLEQNQQLFMKYYDLKIDRNLYPKEVLNMNVDCLDKSLDDLCAKMAKMKK